MSDFPVLAQGLVSESRPQKSVDQLTDTNRLGSYGEVATNSYLRETMALSLEGSAFTTVPTPGSALLLPIVTSYANTAGCFFIQNNNAAGGPSLFLEYLKLLVTTVPASTTSFRYAIWRDNVMSLAITTNHVTATTPVNVNGNSTYASRANVLFHNSATANVNAAPSGNGALIATGSLGGLPILGDALVIDFGGASAMAWGATAVASRKVSEAPSIVIPPQQQIMIVPWLVGNAATAGVFDFELTHFER